MRIDVHLDVRPRYDDVHARVLREEAAIRCRGTRIRCRVTVERSDNSANVGIEMNGCASCRILEWLEEQISHE